MAQGSIVARMQGAATFDIQTYEEVEHDTTATLQAGGVVLMAAVSQALGSWGGGGMGMIRTAILALVFWGFWAGTTYLVGTRLFNGTATWGELLRTLGFAQAPGVLGVLGIIPLLGWVVKLALFFWILAAGIVAIRQALDFGTGKAILTALVGWVVYMAAAIVLGGLGMVASVVT
jgi:hypothetical protein